MPSAQTQTAEADKEQQQAACDTVRIECRHIHKTVAEPRTGRTKTLLDDISLAIEPGEFVCMIGSVGCGKSTLLSVMSARSRFEGRVELNGDDLVHDFESLKRHIAVVPQQNILPERLSVRQALEATVRLRCPELTDDRQVELRVRDSMCTVGLYEHRKTRIADLSGGQLRRLALANELAGKAGMLLVDEVTSGLDERTDREMMLLLRELADAGRTVVGITHNLNQVPEVCDLLVVLTRGGRLAFVGPPRTAPTYFEVSALGDIYQRLDELDPDEWAERFQNSLEYQDWVSARTETTALGTAEVVDSEVDPVDRRAWWYRLGTETRETLRQTRILLQREFLTFTSNRQTLATISGQCLLVSVLMVLVFGDISQEDRNDQVVHLKTILFLMATSCYWFGCNNAAREVVRERQMFEIEHAVNLRIAAYLGAKVLLLGVVSLSQSAVLLFLTRAFCLIPGSLVGYYCLLALAAVSGVTIGLLISCLTRAPSVAVSLVPIVLIPQIMLSDILADLDGLSAALAMTGISTYWSTSALHGLMPEKLAELANTSDNSFFVPVFVLALHFSVAIVCAGSVLFLQQTRQDRWQLVRRHARDVWNLRKHYQRSDETTAVPELQ